MMKRRDRAMGRRERGTVIILVVAVLTLLVVMGTAYLVSSRAEKGTTRAVADTINLDFARDAVMTLIRRSMENTTLNPADGSIYTVPKAWSPNAGTYTQFSDVVTASNGMSYVCTTTHTPDMLSATNGPPPAGINWSVLQPWALGVAYPKNCFVVGPDLKTYQCLVAHTSSGTGSPLNSPPQTATTYWRAQSVGLAAARPYDYPELSPIYSRATSNGPLPDEGWLAKGITPSSSGDICCLQSDQVIPLWSSAPTYASGQLVVGTDKNIYVCIASTTNNTPPNTNYWLMLTSNVGRFNPSTGNADLALGQLATNVVGDTTVVDPQSGTIDGIWNLLPFSGAGGVRYRYSFRVIDTGRMANLNTGNWDSSKTDTKGLYLTSVQLNNSNIFNSSDSATLLHTANGGAQGLQGRGYRIPGGEVYALDEWQSRVLGFERFGVNPAVAAYSQPSALWFDLSDELELRSYGSRGTFYICRPDGGATIPMWHNTLGPGSTKRQFYTTNSWDRNLTPLLGKSYKWTLGSVTMPTAGKMMDLTSNKDPIKNFGMLANLLSASGYSDDEAWSYALNYLGQTDPIYKNGGTIGIPPVVTPSGLVTLTPSATLVTTITPAPLKTYMAYSAQPFLNEAALCSEWISSAPVTTDFAIELYNPYAVTLDISGWRLRFDNAADVWYTFPSGTTLQSGKYMVVTSTGSSSSAGKFTTVGLPTLVGAPLPGAIGDPRLKSQVYLERPYLDYQSRTQYMAVDRIPSNFATYLATSSSTPVITSHQRANKTSASPTPTMGANAVDPWMCTCSYLYSYVRSTDPAWSLGGDNSGVVGSPTQFGLKLVDRFAVSPSPVLDNGVIRGAVSSNLSNIGDLASYMRICNRQEADLSFVPVADQLADPSSVFTTAATGSQFPQEAKVFMDYLADGRAQRFLTFVTSVDRASDGSDQLGDGSGADSINEVRIPGRINVNTAGPEVLHAVVDNFTSLPNAAGGETATSIVNDIIAYRERQAPYSSFPGKGIRSMAELLIPMTKQDGRMNVSGATLVPPSISLTLPSLSLTTVMGTNVTGATLTNSNTTWAKLFSAFTTRSDTFVVYSYMEAIKVHPNTGKTLSQTHDNGLSWYDRVTAGTVAATGTTDDSSYIPPNNTTPVFNLRVSKRRWVAIVDRSWCNYSRGDPNFVLPRVVAIKDLPQ